MEQLPGEVAHPRGLVIKTRLHIYPTDLLQLSLVVDFGNGQCLALRPAVPCSGGARGPGEQRLVLRDAPRGYAPAGQPGAAQPSHASSRL